MKKKFFLLVIGVGALNAMEQESASREELPHEVKSIILTYVPESYHDIAELKRVNQEFNRLVSDPIFLAGFARRLAENNMSGARDLLGEAVKNGDVALTKALIEAYERLLDDARFHLINSAGLDKSVKKLEILLQAGMDVNYQNAAGTSPLMMAVGNNSPEVVKMLIDNGAKVGQQNTHGITALDIALEPGRDTKQEIVELLKETLEKQKSE